MFHWVADLFLLNGFPPYLFCWKSLELQLSTMCNGAYQFEDAELLKLTVYLQKYQGYPSLLEDGMVRLLTKIHSVTCEASSVAGFGNAGTKLGGNLEALCAGSLLYTISSDVVLFCLC